MTTATQTTTISRDGFDMVLFPEQDGFTCTVYRTGSDRPLVRKLVADAVKAEKWFSAQIAKETR